MNRRETILALLALGASPLASFAQQDGRNYRLGWLTPTTQRTEALRTEQYTIALVQRLRKLGFVEGRNLVNLRKISRGQNRWTISFAPEGC